MIIVALSAVITIIVLFLVYIFGYYFGSEWGYKQAAKDYAPTLFNMIEHMTIRSLVQRPPDKCHHCGAEIPVKYLHVQGK